MKNYNKFIAILFALASTITLTSCATSYGQSGFFSRGGLKETKISENTYKIESGGSEYTRLQTTYEYAMRRSAELAASKGYDYFIILDKKTMMVDNSFDTAYGMRTVIQPDTILKVQFVKSQVSGAYSAKKVLAQFTN